MKLTDMGPLPIYFDHPAFLKAIIAKPDEDTPRLAYADWCDECGQTERAEFIRVQIELARIPEPKEKMVGLVTGTDKDRRHYCCTQCHSLPKGQDCRFHHLFDRSRVLCQDLVSLMTKGTTWEEFNGLIDSNADVHRGFIESGVCLSADWIRLGDETLKRHPVRKITWVDLPILCDDQQNSGQRVMLRGDSKSVSVTETNALAAKLIDLAAAKGNAVHPGNALYLSAARLRWPGVEFEIREPRRPTRLSQ